MMNPSTALFGALLLSPLACLGAPILSDPSAGSLELVIADPTNLPRIDGLAFDSHGNLFGALETANSRGGIVAIDKQTGAVTNLSIGVITGADQLKFAPDGTLYVTNELTPTQTTNRLFKVDISYDAFSVPASAIVSSIETGTGLNNPEGLAILQNDAGAFGSAGTVYVGEDAGPGSIYRVDQSASPAPLQALASNLQRAEGIAFGDFGGQRAFALYAAETLTDRIVRIDDQGTVQPFGDPSTVGLSRPDNLDFGPDGLLYVAEDRPGDDRIIRITSDGVHSVFAEGFSAPAGVAFDPLSGDLYIAEQATGSVWRIDFNAVPAPSVVSLLLLGLAQLRPHRRRPRA